MRWILPGGVLLLVLIIAGNVHTTSQIRDLGQSIHAALHESNGADCLSAEWIDVQSFTRRVVTKRKKNEDMRDYEVRHQQMVDAQSLRYPRARG